MKKTHFTFLFWAFFITLGVAVQSFGQQPDAGMGNACKFDAGPRAGQTQDYSQLQPLPIGTPCHDGQGSTGKVVKFRPTPSPTPPPSSMGNACKFDAGPRAGQTQDYRHLPPLPIGTPCHDGGPNTGKVVKLEQPPITVKDETPEPGPSSGMGSACKFDAGPLSGKTKDYSQLGKLPLGTPCHDGKDSSGKVVVLEEEPTNETLGTGSSLGSACKFISGPRNGQTQDYSELGSLPLDTPCTDGQGSNGMVVKLANGAASGGGVSVGAGLTEQPKNGATKSKSCLLLTGSKKGTKSMFPISLRIGMPCASFEGVGLIVP